MRARIKTIAIDDSARRQRLFFTTLLFVVLFSAAAFAEGGPDSSPGPSGTPMSDVLCYVAGIVMGNLGRGLATLAIMTVGIGASIGRITWATGITIAVGIAVVFGAPSIAAGIGFGSSVCPSS